MQKGESENTNLPLTDDRYTRVSLFKIAIDLITDLNVSTSGNQHILTIINHLTGW